MRIEFINPFISAACEVLKSETGSEAKRGTLSVVESPLLSDEVTVLIGVTGDVRGVVMFGMSERTAKRIVTAMVGENVAVFDSMAESAIAEIGNVITGLASAKLEEAGYPCTIAPPTMIVGRNTSISTMSIKRLVVPVQIAAGEVTLHMALRERHAENGAK